MAGLQSENMWKYGFASVAGTAHVRTSAPVQDACRAEIIHDAQGNEMLLAVASDGAGSAAQAHVGSALACDLFVAEVKAHFSGSGEWQHLADGFIESWIEKFQRSVSDRAILAELKPQDFACTLLAAVIGSNEAAYFQLGDGAIVESRGADDDHYSCVCWPQQGEYANTTNFLTDAGAAAKAFRELKAGAVNEVALFTDGIQNLVLDYRLQSAHSPFFAPLFAWLRPRPAGYSAELSAALAAYLNSEKINARTDDDKTLLLATRK
ncbi:MAG: PP2C family serine/threonine-protein phosphatase [Blastocatellia bacterium]